MQLFSADASMFSKRKKFAHETIKKLTSKVAPNRSNLFFFSTVPAAQMAQKQKFRTTKSPYCRTGYQDWDCPLLFFHPFSREQLVEPNPSPLCTFSILALRFGQKQFTNHMKNK